MTSTIKTFCTAAATKAGELYKECKLRASCDLSHKDTNSTAIKAAMFGISILALGASVASFLAGANVISLAGIVAMNLSSTAYFGIGGAFLAGAIALPTTVLLRDEACEACQKKLQQTTIELQTNDAEQQTESK